VVKHVAGEDVAPAPLVMDWDVFRSKLRKAACRTACQRYIKWAASKKDLTEEQELELLKKQGPIV
jgi:hypothetical protein